MNNVFQLRIVIQDCIFIHISHIKTLKLNFKSNPLQKSCCKVLFENERALQTVKYHALIIQGSSKIGEVASYLLEYTLFFRQRAASIRDFVRGSVGPWVPGKL